MGPSIEGTVADGLVKVFRVYCGSTCEICDGSCHAKDAVVGAGAEFKRLHGILKECGGGIVQLTVLTNETGGHSCIVPA